MSGRVAVVTGVACLLAPCAFAQTAAPSGVVHASYSAEAASGPAAVDTTLTRVARPVPTTTPVWARIPREQYILVAAVPPIAYMMGRRWSGTCDVQSAGCASRRTVSTMGAGVLLGSIIAWSTTPDLSRSDAAAIPAYQALTHAVTYGAATWWLPDWLAATATPGRSTPRGSRIAGSIAFGLLEGFATLRGHPLVIDAIGSTVSIGLR